MQTYSVKHCGHKKQHAACALLLTLVFLLIQSRLYLTAQVHLILRNQRNKQMFAFLFCLNHNLPQNSMQ